MIYLSKSCSCLKEQRHKSCKNYDKSEVECRKNSYIVKTFGRVAFNIFTECYKARKRSNKRAGSADIYSEQKLSIIFSKLR